MISTQESGGTGRFGVLTVLLATTGSGIDNIAGSGIDNTPGVRALTPLLCNKLLSAPRCT